MKKIEGIKCKPIVKWAGGKRQILKTLIMNVPEKFNRYYEPFVGGAALFIELCSLNKIKRAKISDINPDLYNLYMVIKEKHDDLIIELDNMEFLNTSDYYYRMRNAFNSTEDPVKKSAILLYLNGHCYNGLFRVNSSGNFNVPFGKYSKVEKPSAENIRKLSEFLSSTEIINADFENSVNDAEEHDFVYFDPPYMPINKTAYFTDYTNKGFNIKDQERLAKKFKELSEKGVYVMETNSNTELIKEIYKEFSMITVSARRNINSDKNRRGNVEELIITNYGVKTQ
ncbi:DNA adenine methylase [Caldiplasma sukawensis]